MTTNLVYNNPVMNSPSMPFSGVLPGDLSTNLAEYYPLASVSIVNNPDGSRDYWVWDNNNKYAFTSIDIHINSANQLTNSTTNWDSGDRSVTLNDYNHQSAWAYTEYVFSPSNQVKSYSYHLDNGSHDDVYFDWANHDSWAWMDYHYDYNNGSGGHLQYLMTVYDDGTKQTQWY